MNYFENLRKRKPSFIVVRIEEMNEEGHAPIIIKPIYVGHDDDDDDDDELVKERITTNLISTKITSML
ncbi:unnamed protein product [Rhizophagus irregularis]|nr:unnamed protein product [Rhizophagus irregularis]CAB5314357.1 unnamed protein product [Rhizophagus irregularis]